MHHFNVPLRSGSRVVMSVTISALKQCPVRLYLQLFVGGIMSYLYYLCLFAYSGVKHNHMRYVFALSSSCVPPMLPVSLRYSLTYIF
jgi:hypothetical protein